MNGILKADFDLLYSRKVTKKYAVVLKEIDLEKEKISLASDSMFMTMFQNEKRIKFSCKFLSYFLKVPYEELLQNLHLSKNVADKKNNHEKDLRCDYVAEILGTYLNIEMNNNSDEEQMKRNMEYAYRKYYENNQKRKGKKSLGSNYNKIIQFNINNFAFVGNDETVEVYVNRNDKGIVLNDDVIFVQIYLPNIRKRWYTLGIEGLAEFERYMLVLIEPSVKESEELGKDDSIMKEYIREAVEASKEPTVFSSYDKEIAFKEECYKDGYNDGVDAGVSQGITQGITQGIAQGIQQVAKSLLEKNVDMQIIQESTGLSLEELENLKTK